MQDTEFPRMDNRAWLGDPSGMESQEDVQQTISNLHKLISQTETSLLLMRGEVERLKKLIEPPEPQAAVSNKLMTSSSVTG